MSKQDYVLVESVPVIALAHGQYKGEIKTPESKFLYSGKVYGGKLPHWLEEAEVGALAKALSNKKAEDKKEDKVEGKKSEAKKEEKKEAKKEEKKEAKEEGTAADLMV